MKKKHFDELIEVIVHEVKKTRDEGQEEYAHTKDNVFANFDRVAFVQNLDREQVLMTYLLKHIDGIMSYIKGHKSQREDITGRLKDAIVYLMLLWGMVEEERSLLESFTNKKLKDS